MSTRLQEKLAQNIVQDIKSKTPLNKKTLLVQSGYSEISAKANPGVYMRAKGVQTALVKLGISEGEADEVVNEILHKGKREDSRLKAADLIYKRLGSFAPEKKVTLNIFSKVLESIETHNEHLLGGGSEANPDRKTLE